MTEATIRGDSTPSEEIRILGRLARRKRRPLDPAEAYRRWAADYGREHNAFQELEAGALERLLPALDGRAVLDAGGGKGRVAALALARGASRAVAADFSLAMLAGARAGHRVAADVGALPFLPETFDVVVCALVLGHVADLDRALAALAAVLRPGGHLLISDFHPFATLRGWQRTFTDGRGRTHAIEQHLHLFADYVGAFRRLGLALEELEEPCWGGSPVVFAMRARKP
ncbi:MAG TPA: class I SAM-dependent methyltransferase [Thermoanaerobaculia bacterium]|jgi:malonyl-CoA O-methyltransferase